MTATMSVSSRILNTIDRATSPLLSYKDFLKKMEDVGYNTLRSELKALRDSGIIETSDVGYRRVIPLDVKPGETIAKAKPGATIKERKALPKKVGVPCLCGCGGITKPGSFFLMGHDARTKGYVIKANKGKMDVSVLRTALDYGAVIVHKGVYAMLAVADIRKIGR